MKWSEHRKVVTNPVLPKIRSQNAVIRAVVTFFFFYTDTSNILPEVYIISQELPPDCQLLHTSPSQNDVTDIKGGCVIVQQILKVCSSKDTDFVWT